MSGPEALDRYHIFCYPTIVGLSAFSTSPDDPSPPTEEGDVLTETIEEHEIDTSLIPKYYVILLDDNHHSYDYVIEMLIDLFGHSQSTAFDMACTVDKEGKVIVETTHKERAEMKKDQIHGYGADWRIPHCKGSMSAIVEPAN